jgi:hypothetical protein
MPYPESNASYQALRLLGQFFGSDAALLLALWAEAAVRAAAHRRAEGDGDQGQRLLQREGGMTPPTP